MGDIGGIGTFRDDFGASEKRDEAPFHLYLSRKPLPRVRKKGHNSCRGRVTTSKMSNPFSH